MGMIWKRNYRITVKFSDGQKLIIPKLSEKVITALRMTFDISRIAEPGPVIGTFKIFNLSVESQRKIEQYGYYLTLEAGYGIDVNKVDFELIYQGDISTVMTLKQDVDYETTITCGDGLIPLRYAFLNISSSFGSMNSPSLFGSIIDAITKPLDIMLKSDGSVWYDGAVTFIENAEKLLKEIADKKTSSDVADVDIDTYQSKGFAAHMKASKALDYICKMHGLSWVINHSVFEVFPRYFYTPKLLPKYGKKGNLLKTTTVQNDVSIYSPGGAFNTGGPNIIKVQMEYFEEKPILVSKENGMIGTPQRIERGGIIFRSLLNAKLLPNRVAVVKSDHDIFSDFSDSESVFAAPFRLFKVRQFGDTHGDDWTCECEGYPVY